MPEEQTTRLICSLRHAAQDRPVRLGAEQDQQMAVLSQDCRRWLDTLA
ncbi:hypothetical protein AB0N77_21365 [Streptomyces misionensis]